MKIKRDTLNILAAALLLSLTACNFGNKKSESAQQVAGEDPVAATAEEAPVADERGYIVKVGDPLPDFTVLYGPDKEVPVSNYKGKVIMLQFTASWCGVCRKEMPFIESDIWQKHKDNEDFLLLGIDLKEDMHTVEGFAKSIPVTYPITLDPDGERFALFCGPDAGVTRNIIVDRDGKMVMLTRLYEEEEFAQMCKLIDSLLIK